MSRSTETGPTTTDLGNGARSAEARDSEGRRLNLTAAQIGTSAGAAATSALGASFFGAAGTITGAALGAVISTVAGAVYSHSLETAKERLRDSDVLVRKVPVGFRSHNPGSVPTHLGREVAAGNARQAAAEGATPAEGHVAATHAMPTDAYAATNAMPADGHGDPPTQPTQSTVPIEAALAAEAPAARRDSGPGNARSVAPDPGRSADRNAEFDAGDELGAGDAAATGAHTNDPAATGAHTNDANVPGADVETAIVPTAVPATAAFPPVDGTTQSIDGATPSSPQEAAHLALPHQAAPVDGRPRRRQVAVLGGVALAGFGLALGGITVVESLLGRPVSGGDGGTTISRVAQSSTSGSSDQETKPSPTESSDPSPEPTETSTRAATEDAEPTQEPTESPSETAEPEQTEPAPTDTGDTSTSEEGEGSAGAGELGADAGATATAPAAG